jgi:aminodeoxyfutalosine synthase
MSDEATKRRSDEGEEESVTPSVASSLRRFVASRACFNCVIPLSFIPENSELGALPGPTGLTDLKTLAIARLMLDNIAHIKAFWIMQGIGLSQLALSYGCDDLDGTVVWYDITKRQGGTTHQELHEQDLRRLIREAGRTPVERDTLYRPIRRDGAVDSEARSPELAAS